MKHCEDVEVLCLCPEDIKRFCNFEQTGQVRLWCLARPESDDEESDFDDMGGPRGDA